VKIEASHWQRTDGKNRPAFIRQKQPARLHLTAKRRTTSGVQPLRIGSVDHKRLGSDGHRFPLRTFREVHQLLAIGSRICTLVPEFHIFFCPVCGGSVTGGGEDQHTKVARGWCRSRQAENQRHVVSAEYIDKCKTQHCVPVLEVKQARRGSLCFQGVCVQSSHQPNQNQEGVRH